MRESQWMKENQTTRGKVARVRAGQVRGKE